MTRFLASFVVFLVLMTLVAAPLSAQQAVGTAAVIPLNMQVNPVLVDVVNAILAVSPAFAAQCATIADAGFLRVVITPVMASSTTSRGSARTTMRRYASGALIAAVEMPVPLTAAEYAELFGHELEHVIEQIERVDLQAMTEARDGATRLADGSYETVRARRAGLLITDEIEHPRTVAAAARAVAASFTEGEGAKATRSCGDTKGPPPAEVPASPVTVPDATSRPLNGQSGCLHQHPASTRAAAIRQN